MKAIVLTLFAALPFLFGSGAIAEDPPSNPPARPRLLKGEPQARPMYEDIEILRRLLDRGLREAEPRGVTAAAFSPDGKFLNTFTANGMVRLWDAATGKALNAFAGAGDPHASLNVQMPQGTYLRGYGIVYTMTLPAEFRPGPAQPGQPAPRPLSEWERMRKELRGEKVKPEEGAARTNPSVVDALLKIVADNGHNLSQLPDNERVTLAITLATTLDCAKCHDAIRTGDLNAPARIGWRGPMGTDAARGVVRGDFDNDGRLDLFIANDTATRGRAATDLASKEVRDAIEARKAEARKQALLGDMHAKNGQQREAAEAYQKAVDAYEKLLDWQRRVNLDLTGLPGHDAQADLDAVEFYTKVAHFYLAAGEKAKALRVMDKMATYAARAGQGSANSKPADKHAAIPLPSKLILSVSKSLLDQVGSGKMSFDDFRKHVSIEYLDFGPPLHPPIP